MRAGYVLVLFYCTLCTVGIRAQRKMDLSEVLDIATTSSIHSKLSQTEQKIAFYLYQSYRSEYRPQISFYGSVPMYTKAYSPITQPDGTIKFLPISQNYSYAGLSLSQSIPLTGGTISFNSGLNRFDDFYSDLKQYNATPFFIALRQPLAGFNALKWAKMIEPLRFKEKQKEYVFNIENIKLQATELYFKVLDAQNNVQVYSSNLADYISNYDTEKERIDLGTTNEEKITHLELQILEAEQNLQKAQYELKVAKLNLKVLTGLSEADDFVVSLPLLKNMYYPDVNSAIQYAKMNRPEFLSFQRKLMEAKADVARARAEKQQITLSATLGYNNTGVRFKDAYQQLKTQQSLGLEIDIPIVDWGRRNAKISVARANLELQEYQNKLDEITIAQEITTLVENLVLLQRNVIQAEKVKVVAVRRYGIAKELYMMGKYNITDLSIAQRQKDDAQKNQIEALKMFWLAHYSFRKLTGYDPETNQSLAKPQY